MKGLDWFLSIPKRGSRTTFSGTRGGGLILIQGFAWNAAPCFTMGLRSEDLIGVGKRLKRYGRLLFFYPGA